MKYRLNSAHQNYFDNFLVNLTLYFILYQNKNKKNCFVSFFFSRPHQAQKLNWNYVFYKNNNIFWSSIISKRNVCLLSSTSTSYYSLQYIVFLSFFSCFCSLHRHFFIFLFFYLFCRIDVCVCKLEQNGFLIRRRRCDK